MTAIPALCNQCGSLFAFHGIQIGNGANVTMSGNLVGPCPNCGGFGSIPDGVYSSVGNILRIIAAATTNSALIGQKLNALRAAQLALVEDKADAKLVVQDTPELASFGDLVPKTRTELYAFLALLIAALVFLQSFSNKDGIIQMPIGGLEAIIQESVNRVLQSRDTPLLNTSDDAVDVDKKSSPDDAPDGAP